MTTFNETGVRVSGIRRGGRIERQAMADWAGQKGDTLIVVATTSGLLTILEERRLRVGLRRSIELEPDAEVRIVEAILTPSQ